MEDEQLMREHLALFELTIPYTTEELQRSYRDLVQVWHPDRYTHNERLKVKAEEKLKLVNQAYEDLSKNCEAINKRFAKEQSPSRKRGKSHSKSAPQTKESKYASLSSAAMEAQDYAQAYRYNVKWLEVDPHSHVAWLGKGTSAGWQSTFLQPRLTEMCVCYEKALQYAPPESREALVQATAAVKAQVIDAFFPICKNALLEALPTAGVNASGYPEVWAMYVSLCAEMLDHLDAIHLVMPENPDLMRLVIAICANNLEGVKYTDYTTTRFNAYASRIVFLHGEVEDSMKRKMMAYTQKLQAIEPNLPTPQINKVSPGCFVATCACDSPDHPYVVTLRQFRDNQLRRLSVGRLCVALYNRYGPHVAAFIQNKPLCKSMVLAFLIRPLAILVARMR